MAVTGDLTRYRYLSTIGTGGMATVDLAEDSRLGRQVALKRFTGAADDGMSRLRREALAGASISHPNLVSVYDAVTSENGDLVIVMEYVRGETLRQTLNRRGALPVSEVLRILDGVAAGLDAIHARGIVHRDVKPSNILLGEDGAVKVADLGIASVPDRTQITTSGSVLGSLSYMAPEQLGEERSTPAIDIYALAAVAYEMLSGVKARQEANAVALAHAIHTQPAPDLRAAWPQAPAAAADVIRRAMSADPAQRPSSAGELARRLGAALEEPET
ncbi:MAG: serine/threonine-protein kinase, partial [Solirubrobacteraceae bacterium]